jgi:hypothetical protein
MKTGRTNRFSPDEQKPAITYGTESSDAAIVTDFRKV